MKILFIGHRGIPPRSLTDTDERRVMALASKLAECGHDVFAVTCRSYANPAASRWGGLRIIRLPSFDPRISGGLFYALAQLFVLWRFQPDAVHIHGWMMSLLAPIARLLAPRTTFVWTVSHIPSSRRGSRVVRILTRLIHHITAPTREIQYRLLTEYGVRAVYVPDGYELQHLRSISAKHFALSRGQYIVLLARTMEEVLAACKAYQSASRKKLLVLMNDNPEQYKKMARRYPFLRVIAAPGSRARRSLIQNAAAIIALSPEHSCDVLCAMDSTHPVFAANVPAISELVGVHARTFSTTSERDLTRALLEKGRRRQGLGARTRARTHFSWQRIAHEYEQLYHPMLRLVSLDSAARTLTPTSVSH